MSRRLPLKDFRGRRKVLVRSDFGYAPKPLRRTSDQIDQETWDRLVILRDDVAIRTSNRNLLSIGRGAQNQRRRTLTIG